MERQGTAAGPSLSSLAANLRGCLVAAARGLLFLNAAYSWLLLARGAGSVLNRFRQVIRRRRSKAECDQSVDQFSTHMPVLLGISKIFTSRHVLELGGGRFSTPLFLNPEVFPAVERVLTLENDAEWAREVSIMVGEEPKHQLTIVEGTIASEVAALAVEKFDLVFIDDSKTICERLSTFKEITSRIGPQSVVIMHDFEAPEYQLAATGFRNRLLITGYYPATGILWNDALLEARQLEALCTIIRLSATRLRPDDITSWQKSLSVLGD